MTGQPQFYIYHQSRPYCRGGPWSGEGIAGVPAIPKSPYFNFTFVNNENEISLVYTTYDPSALHHFVLDELGVFQRLTWIDRTKQWHMFWSIPRDRCDVYKQCGLNANSKKHSGIFSNSKRSIIVLVLGSTAAVFGILFGSSKRIKLIGNVKMKGNKEKFHEFLALNDMLDSNLLEDSEEHIGLLLFDLDKITAATNNFSNTNKLGEGGFGTVYKAWDFWREGKALELIDPLMERNSYPVDGILRCIQVGLLCVQGKASDRPTMATVVNLLGKEAAMPPPKAPAYIMTDHSSTTCSINNVTVTIVQARE
ncbi:hypothetical protein QUC31_001964 [Theobroma cacao]